MGHLQSQVTWVGHALQTWASQVCCSRLGAPEACYLEQQEQQLTEQPVDQQAQQLTEQLVEQLALQPKEQQAE